MHGDAPAVSRGERLAPAGFFSGGLQHLQVAGVLGQKPAAVLVGVLACGMGQFVQEALHDKGGVGVPDRAPPEHRHGVFRAVQFHLQVGDGIGGICGPFHRRIVDAVLDHGRLEERCRR